jgi:hypothetical protein
MRARDFAAAWEISDAVSRERASVPGHHWPLFQVDVASFRNVLLDGETAILTRVNARLE